MKGLIKSALSAAGVEIRLRRNVVQAWEEEKREAVLKPWRKLIRFQPKMILDIGANDGFSVKQFRKIFPCATILSFEPLADCFSKVESVIQQSPPGRAFHCALGDEDGTAVIHKSDFSPSSSLLPMDELHRTELPHTAKGTEEQIQVRRLDGLMPELRLEFPLIAKIDVQGFEDRVIRGGEIVLRQAAAIVVELSSYSLYQGQACFSGVHAQLEAMGFVFRGTIDQMLSPRDGRILQFDALFENVQFSEPS